MITSTKRSARHFARHTTLTALIASLLIFLYACLARIEFNTHSDIYPGEEGNRTFDLDGLAYNDSTTSEVFYDAAAGYSQLVTRAPSQLWTECEERGKMLKRLMEARELPDKDETTFKDYSQLKQYGWQQDDGEASKVDADFYPTLQAAPEILCINELPESLAVLNVLKNDKDFIKVDWRHWEDSKDPVTGQVYPKTDAYFVNLYNPAVGIIIATHNMSPQNVKNPPPKKQLVPLQRWSDVVALTWSHLCQQKKQPQSNLKWILQTNVVEGHTRQIVDEALGDYSSLKAWPGVTYDLTEPTGLALLGSANGNGAGWLLAQHKGKLGTQRTVKKIWIWNGKFQARTPPELAMLFQLGDP